MAITLVTGTVAAIASTYGSSKTMSAISNASQAVATLEASHGVIVGDYLEVTSGWSKLDKRIVRVSAVSTNDVTFENINTSSTTNYPAGTGTGSVREITAWTTIQQLKGSTSSGGDQQFADITTIDDLEQRQAPTIRSATVTNLTVFDDPSLSWYTAAIAADEARTPYAVRFSFPNGSKLLANAYWSVQRTPGIQTNQALETQVTLTYAAQSTRYAT